MTTVEEKNEQGLETATIDNPPVAPLAETADSITIHSALRRLLRKRVKKFVAWVPEIRADANPKIVHDARVWSRRLQQAIGAFFPKPRSGKVRRLRRTPRRIRRLLGEWRNCDVLLEMVARQQRRTRSEAKRRAWAFVRDYLLHKREKQVARAGKKLLHQDPPNYVSLAQKLIARPTLFQHRGRRHLYLPQGHPYRVRPELRHAVGAAVDVDDSRSLRRDRVPGFGLRNSGFVF